RQVDEVDRVDHARHLQDELDGRRRDEDLDRAGCVAAQAGQERETRGVHERHGPGVDADPPPRGGPAPRRLLEVPREVGVDLAAEHGDGRPVVLEHLDRAGLAVGGHGRVHRAPRVAVPTADGRSAPPVGRGRLTLVAYSGTANHTVLPSPCGRTPQDCAIRSTMSSPRPPSAVGGCRSTDGPPRDPSVPSTARTISPARAVTVTSPLACRTAFATTSDVRSASVCSCVDAMPAARAHRTTWWRAARMAPVMGRRWRLRLPSEEAAGAAMGSRPLLVRFT